MSAQEANPIENVAVSLIRSYELAAEYAGRAFALLGGLIATSTMTEGGVKAGNLVLAAASAAIFCCESEPLPSSTEFNPSQ